MKSKKKAKSKTRSKSKTHTTRTKAPHKHNQETSPLNRSETIPSPSLTLNTTLKTCQEVEVGDIGGFGSSDELEEHEKRCSEPGTEFCTNCGRTLCHSHYDLLHRDHDRPLGHSTGNPTGVSLA
jgi:hypothetical protein